MDAQNSSLAKFDKAVLAKKATWWQMDLPSGDVIFGSAKSEMLGYPQSDFKHYQDFTKLLHHDDYNQAMTAMKNHLNGKNKFYDTIYRIKAKNGNYIKFYDCGQIIKKDKENITVMGFVWKIEDGKNIEAQVAEIKKIILDGNPSMIDLITKIK